MHCLGDDVSYFMSVRSSWPLFTDRLDSQTRSHTTLQSAIFSLAFGTLSLLHVPVPHFQRPLVIVCTTKIEIRVWDLYSILTSLSIWDLRFTHCTRRRATVTNLIQTLDLLLSFPRYGEVLLKKTLLFSGLEGTMSQFCYDLFLLQEALKMQRDRTTCHQYEKIA